MHAAPTGTAPKMSTYRAAGPTNRPRGTMYSLGLPTSSAPTLQPPNMPSAPALAAGTGSNLTVTWTFPAIDNAHGAATGFNLRSSPTGMAAWMTVWGAISPFNLSGMAGGAAIDVQIQSLNTAGASAWSAISTLTTATTAFIPNTPSASLALGTGSTLIVTWVAPAVDSTHSAATAYNVQFSPSGAGTWTTVSGVITPYNLSGLAAGAAIDVRVQSSNATGVSAWSAIFTLTTGIIAYAPNAPGAAALAHGSGSDLAVTWTAPTIDGTHNAATAFNLRWSPSGAATWTTVSGVTSPCELTGLAAGAAIDVQLQGSNVTGTSGWSATTTLTTATAGSYAPNAPAIASVAAPPDGTATKLAITWAASVVDNTHNAATGYNLRSSPTGAGTWTIVSGVTSPYTLTGLAGATAIDIEVQATNAAVSPGAWSGITTGTTWGATVAPATWVAAAAQVHNTSVAPNGGVQMTAVAAPTAITGTSFAWSTSGTTVPTTGLIAATLNGQTNGWGQYFNAPATAGTFYLWMLTEGTSTSATGALVTSAITVS